MTRAFSINVGKHRSEFLKAQVGQQLLETAGGDERRARAEARGLLGVAPSTAAMLIRMGQAIAEYPAESDWLAGGWAEIRARIARASG